MDASMMSGLMENNKNMSQGTLKLMNILRVLLLDLNSSNKCNSKELTREVSCVKWHPQKLVKRKRGAHELLYTANPGRKISYFSIM